MRKGSGAQPGQLILFTGSAAEPREREVEADGAVATATAPITTADAVADPAGVTESARDTPLPGRRARTRVVAPRMSAPRPRVPPSPHVTLDQAIPDYITYLTALGRSQHTIKSFELDLRLLREQLGNRAVGVIDTGHLRQFIAWVRVTRANTPNSLRRKVATLKNFFRYLSEEGYISSNPADLVPYPEVQMPLPEFLEEDEALRLVEVTEDNPFWRALIVLLLDTGLKRDEALALRVADAHLDDSAASPAGSYLVVRETDAAKRLRTRKLPVSERLRDALRAYYKAAHHTEAGESRVFDVSVRGINFIVEECGKRAGIETSKPRLTPQALRETFAVARMRARVQEEQRCQMRGWNGEQMQLLTLRHDAELLDLLGLKEDPDTARKYRQLVKA